MKLFKRRVFLHTHRWRVHRNAEDVDTEVILIREIWKIGKVEDNILLFFHYSIQEPDYTLQSKTDEKDLIMKTLVANQKCFVSILICLLLLVSLCAVLIIGVTGCGQDDDNEWVGTWTLETVDGENIQVQFAAIKLLLEAFGETETDFSYIDIWTFDDDGTWDREVTIEIETAGDREISSFEIMGTYSLSDSNYTITVNELTVTAEGSSDFEEEVDAGPELGDTETGTWSRNGNTLTLTGDSGQVLGLKKK